MEPDYARIREIELEIYGRVLTNPTPEDERRDRHRRYAEAHGVRPALVDEDDVPEDWDTTWED